MISFGRERASDALCSAIAAARSEAPSRSSASEATSKSSSTVSSCSVAGRTVSARANASHARANDRKLVRPPLRCAASIGQMPPWPSV